MLQRVGQRSEHQTAFHWILVILACFPAIAASWILYRQALPLPYQDDYHAILEFAVKYEQLPGLEPKILIITTAQHNEYKLGLEHTILASELEATHHINFTFLTVLGDLFLFPMGYLVWLIYRQDGPDRLLAFLPIAFLFFALTYWENQNWAMTGLQNTPVILFSLLAIYLIAPRDAHSIATPRLLLGCAAAALAAFTSANGFLLVPLGLPIFLPRRQYTRTLLWFAAFLVPLAAYLYHLSPVPHQIGRRPYITRPLSFFGFLGTVSDYRWPAVFLGMVIMIVVLLAVWFRFDRANPPAALVTLWILLTGCLVAWVRGAAGIATGSRYSFYSILMLIFCYSFLAHALPARWPAFNRKAFYVSATVLAALFCCAADLRAWQKLELRRQMVMTGIEHYRARPDVNSPMIDPNVVREIPKEIPYERIMLTEAIHSGVYSLPTRP